MCKTGLVSEHGLGLPGQGFVESEREYTLGENEEKEEEKGEED